MDLSDDLAQLYPAFLVAGDVLVPEEWAAWKAAEDRCSEEKEHLKRRATVLVQDMDLGWKRGCTADAATKPALSTAAHAKPDLSAAAHEAKVAALRSFGVALAAEAFRRNILRTPDRSELEC